MSYCKICDNFGEWPACGNCGKPWHDGNKFCGKCGKDSSAKIWKKCLCGKTYTPRKDSGDSFDDSAYNDGAGIDWDNWVHPQD